MKIPLTLLFILLIGCTRQTNDVSQKKDSTPTIQSFNALDFTIKDGQISNLKTGELLDSVLRKLRNAIVLRDSVPECPGCDTYSPLYVVKDIYYEDLFAFEPGWDSTDHDKLFRIRTNHKKFVTDKGVRVGMTVKDLKEKYEIEEVDASGETGLHVMVKGFDGSFGIELPAIDDWWTINKANLPDSLKIDEIIIL